MEKGTTGEGSPDATHEKQYHTLERVSHANTKRINQPIMDEEPLAKMNEELPNRTPVSTMTNMTTSIPQTPNRVVKFQDLPYMGEMTLDNSKPRRGRKPKKADICHLIYKNYGTIFPGTPNPGSYLEKETKKTAAVDIHDSSANRNDVQHKIISSLLERRLTQENGRSKDMRRIEKPNRFSFPEERGNEPLRISIFDTILGSTQENSCRGAPSEIASSSTEVSDNSPDVSLENEMFTELPSNSGMMDDSSISASGIQESSDDPESDQPTDSHAIDPSFDDLRISSRGRPKKFPGNNDEEKDTFIKYISSKFDINNLGLAKKNFGINIAQSGGKIMLNQKYFISKLIRDFGLEDAKTMATPLEPNLKLTKVSRLDPEKLARIKAELKRAAEATLFQSVDVSMSSDVFQPWSSNRSQPPPSSDSALALPSIAVEYGSSVALSQSVTASSSTDMNSGSSTSIIRTSPNNCRSFELLLLQRLNKTVAPKKLASTTAIVTSEEWIASKNKKKQEMEEKESRKRLKKLGGGVNKKNKEIMVTSDSDSYILSEIDFADEDSSDYDREDFRQDMQREKKSDLEFEKTLGNCNNSDTHYQHTTPEIND
ncbi:hypothetical protein JTB14_015371 [Gonioctena quinquepunctata]|nr:hypothetical protein JTB14_015371 [Gonioctena quinquepunctata]